MTTRRQAACNPCRQAKLSCDHKRPVCGRCELSDKSAHCVYRVAPFKRRRNHASTPILSVDQEHRIARQEISTPNAPGQRNPYPNPGHFGSRSHVAIFSQIPLSNNQNQVTATDIEHQTTTQLLSSAVSADLGNTVEQVAGLLKHLLDSFDLTGMKNLVDFWCAKGTSLALAERILPQCIGSVEYLQNSVLPLDPEWHRKLTVKLMEGSAQPLKFCETMLLQEYTDQFCGRHVRWETLGTFFAAVIRATFDVTFFPDLYTTETRKQELRTLTARLNRSSLDLCLSLDCLNDLQLIFQYENTIVQSYVDGDHNLSYYRSLGDSIAFIFALGYHENIQSKPDVPPFLVELRKTAFARIYSADKNVAIFLGRPPRESLHDQADQDMYDWPNNAKMDYTAETRWTALCAAVKEDILEFLLSADRHALAQTRPTVIDQIEQLWLALPEKFRLHGNLKDCSSHTPFELDFLANTRLNYLHTLFVLHLGSLSTLTDPDNTVVELARQMLSLTVETTLLRDCLVNSGISLIWKIAHYGLPAAGVLLLAMLGRNRHTSLLKPSSNRVWQDLNIISAEIQAGSIIRSGEPLYELLTKATSTIQAFLESVNIDGHLSQVEESAGDHQSDPTIDSWTARCNADFWNMETEFWQNLAEHPYIVGLDTVDEEQRSGDLSGFNF